MGLQLMDENGNPVELPVEKVEDILALQEQAGQVEGLKTKVTELEKGQNPNWAAVRDRMAKLEEENAKFRSAVPPAPPAEQPPASSGAPAPVDETKVAEIAKTKAEEAIQQSQATARGKAIEKAVARLANGDENRAKVILEKYNQLALGKQVSDEETMNSILSDAVHLADRNKSGQSGTAFERSMGGGGAGHGAPAPTPDKASLDRGKEIAVALGYQFKSDKDKK